jgi:radical SAM superfamily enzyme YgiQ (UPF0313 family)
MALQNHRPLCIYLIEVSSASHYSLWNALSAETLAGDIRGTYKNRVSVAVRRVRKASDVDVLIQELPPSTGVVGVSVELGSLPLTRHLVDALKNQRRPKGLQPQIVFGNTIPTYLPNIFLDMCPSAIVVRGEGEISFRGIINHLLNDVRLEDVPSLVYRKNRSDFATRWEPPDLALLLHSPSIDTLDDVLSNQGSALMESSRGCPWSRCAYCSISSFRNGRLWESLPFSRILDNLEHLVRAGIREIEFTDADFIGGRTICGY